MKEYVLKHTSQQMYDLHKEFIDRFFEKFDLSRLVFEPIKHEYLIDGIKYESVSNVIKPNRATEIIDVPKEIMEKLGKKGMFIHDLTHKIDIGQKNKEKAIRHSSESIRLNLHNYYLLLDNKRFEVVLSEIPLWDEENKIAGTIDKIVYDLNNDWYLIIDLKTGRSNPTHQTQVEMYGKLLARMKETTSRFDIAPENYLCYSKLYEWLKVDSEQDYGANQAIENYKLKLTQNT